MDEHQIPMHELAARLSTNVDTVSFIFKLFSTLWWWVRKHFWRGIVRDILWDKTSEKSRMKESRRLSLPVCTQGIEGIIEVRHCSESWERKHTDYRSLADYSGEVTDVRRVPLYFSNLHCLIVFWIIGIWRHYIYPISLEKFLHLKLRRRWGLSTFPISFLLLSPLIVRTLLLLSLYRAPP